MAYDSVRAQLDKLLGPDRNGPINPSKAKTPHYTDDSVCKFFLLGFCPTDLHIKHRSEPGSCPNLHSDVVKAAFETDVAAGKLRRERVRWTRELLRECRSILYDEDRKIRGHARRLQETYNATGDLSGLMIRNFDTLKKLGMVRKSAKIRILSEMDDPDDFEDESDQPDQPADETRAADGTEAKSAPKNSAEPAKEGEKAAAEGGDDDDLEGFGIVQVIPAAESPSSTHKSGKHTAQPKTQPDEEVDEFGRIKVKKPDEKQDEQKTTIKPVETKAFGDDDDDDDGFGLIKIIPANGNRDDSSDEEDAAAAKAQQKENSSSPDLHAKKASPPRDEQVKNAEKKSEGKEGGNPSGASHGKEKTLSDAPEPNDAETQPEDGKEADSETLNPEQVMEKFYEAGKGPDGLLMLDKKQSLRVCQCCGGYISLVDAESRLLSHYGGKSHHSLAQLRAKVPELEEHLAQQPSHLDEDPPRSAPRHWSERDRDRARGDDDRHRNGGYHDRYAGRSGADSEGGRGYGTTTWYSGTGRSDDAYREYGRRDDDRYRSDDRRRDDRHRSDSRYADRQRDDRFKGERNRDGRHRDERYRDDRYGSGDRYGRDYRHSRDHRQRDDYATNERYHDDRSRNRDGGRYDSGRKRQRSTSPPRNNRRSRRQY